MAASRATRGSMPRFKHIDTNPRLLPVDLAKRFALTCGH